MATRTLHKDVGDLWSEPVATFTVGGSATDPTNLTVKQQAPDGTETTILNNVLVSTLTGSSTPIKKTGVGQFQPNPGIDLTTPGHWYLKFSGTGAVTASETHEVVVDPDEFSSLLNTRALVTMGEAKDYLAQQSIDTSNDLELARVINDLSDRFYEESEREFKVWTTNPQTRTFDVDKSGVYQASVYVGDLTSFTTVRILDRDAVEQSTVASGDIIPFPRNRKPWQPIRRLKFTPDVQNLMFGYLVEVTGVWGFPAVPGNVRQAVLDAVAQNMDKDVEHYSADLGPQADTRAANVILVGNSTQRFVTLPPSAQAVAWYYRDEVIL